MLCIYITWLDKRCRQCIEYHAKISTSTSIAEPCSDDESRGYASQVHCSISSKTDVKSPLWLHSFASGRAAKMPSTSSRLGVGKTVGFIPARPMIPPPRDIIIRTTPLRRGYVCLVRKMYMIQVFLLETATSVSASSRIDRTVCTDHLFRLRRSSENSKHRILVEGIS